MVSSPHGGGCAVCHVTTGGCDQLMDAGDEMGNADGITCGRNQKCLTFTHDALQLSVFSDLCRDPVLMSDQCSTHPEALAARFMESSQAHVSVFMTLGHRPT